MDGRISTYGFALDMISKNSRLQKQLGQIQEQIATGVKSSTLQGYGVDNLRLQNARINVSSIDSYIFNIESASSRIKQMTVGVSEIEKQAEIVLGALAILPQEGDIDITNMKTLAGNAKDIIEDILNQKIGEDYLFSGSDVKNTPLENSESLTMRVQLQMTQWLDGTNDADTFAANIDSYTDSQAGFSLGVQSSSEVFVRADDNFEVDYTVRANENGFKDILVGLTALSEMQFPDDTVDLATREEFFQIIDGLFRKVQGGVEEIRGAEIKLAAADGSIGRKLEQHKTDKGFLQTTIENIQSIDPSEAVVRFQALQTNLEAAFQATSIISSLSLARLL
jgi:flagellar hook-associated protein 3 FlgL